MPSTFKIHPAIGIARLGNHRPDGEPDADFYITPEQPAGLPIKCDGKTGLPPMTNEQEETTTKFKLNGRIVRQAARFRVYAYDDDGTPTEVTIGQPITVIGNVSGGRGAVGGQTVKGTVKHITWSVYLANKKAIWYEFQERSGEHGYASTHPLRNATITDDNERRQLIIDPGPQTVGTPTKAGDRAKRASFAKGANGNHAQRFPPPLTPHSIDTLGELYGTRDTDDHSRLLVLGGYGNSGSMRTGALSEAGQPTTTSYANNDGWFDDTADGPVNATVTIAVDSVDGQPPVKKEVTVSVEAAGAWVLSAYPAYLPEIENIVRLDEAVHDVAVRELAAEPHLYGTPPFDGSTAPTTPGEVREWRNTSYFNPDYYPYFWRDIWPILRRPQYLVYLLVFDPLLGGVPHQSDDPRTNFFPGPLSVAPHDGQDPATRERNRQRRYNIYNALRKPGQDNQYQITPDPDRPDYSLRGMPELCGDNPISNTLPRKFFTLTPTMLFLLKQWADGKFINECTEGLVDGCTKSTAYSVAGDATEEIVMPPASYWYHPPTTPAELDRGVLANGLGGSFCPGGEVTWIIRNPAIYTEPFRIRQSDAFAGAGLSGRTPPALTMIPAPQPGAANPAGEFSATVPGGIVGGLEPGDITKYHAVPWQVDFNECATQKVDITYEDYNQTSPASTGDPFPQRIQQIWWWPTHRPIWVNTKGGGQVEWSRGIPATLTGDQMMVRAWSGLGFVIKATPEQRAADANVPAFYEAERNQPLIADDSDDGER